MFIFKNGWPVIACLIILALITEINSRYTFISLHVLFIISILVTSISALFTTGYIVYWRKSYTFLSNRKKLFHLLKVTLYIWIVLLNGVVTFGLYQFKTNFFTMKRSELPYLPEFFDRYINQVEDIDLLDALEQLSPMHFNH